MIARLWRWLMGHDADPAWRPTGVRPMTVWHYDEQAAVRAARKARTRTASGRVYKRPQKAPLASEPMRLRRVK